MNRAEITKRMPEILSPAGSIESFYAAINNGADAVYLGGKAFNARNSANNFSDEEIEKAIDYAHRRGSKVYITLNTLYKNSEVTECLKFADKMYQAGADAFIMQDIGVSQEVKRLFPKIKLHASTQMSIHSLEGAKYLENYGFDRVVLARELSLLEVRKINDNVKIETESFVHGALCISYSGQCLMSSIIGGRSGNRGRCAQPCRMMYDLVDEDENIIKKGHLLSPRDMMTLEILDEIVESGVASLKIEGRMKSPEYVGVVTNAYSVYLNNKQKDKMFIENVNSIFNRGGHSTSGYYKNNSSVEMMSIETPKGTGLYIGEVLSYEKPKGKNQKGRCVIKAERGLVPGDGIEIWTESLPHIGTNISQSIEAGDRFFVNITGEIKVGDKVFKSYDKALVDKAKWQNSQDSKKLIIEGSLHIKKDEPMKITLKFSDILVEKCGEMALKAQNQPLSEEKIVSQFSKTGGTTYNIDFKNNVIDNDIFVAVSSINSLRREALEQFDEIFVNSFKRKSVNVPKHSFEANIENEKEFSAQVSNLAQLNSALNAGITRVYYPYNGKNVSEVKKAVEYASKNDAEIYLAFSKISRNEFLEKIDIDNLENTGIKGYLASTYGQLNIVRENNVLPIILDYTFNMLNSLSVKFFEEQGIYTTLSQELTLAEGREINNSLGEAIVYGRQIMMMLENCPVGLYAANKSGSKKYCKNRKSQEKFYLIDRKKAKFPTYNDCEQCVSYILNTATLCMNDKLHDLQRISAKYLRLMFFDESGEEVYEIAKAYLNGEEVNHEEKEKTHGHYYRGVD
ncbi:MAG: U32 family peptidase [Defluviitaleaceae bacterium]|nr:U32 family peptidase [Defluviitaleaceae bacterium]